MEFGSETGAINPKIALLTTFSLGLCGGGVYSAIKINQFFESPTGQTIKENSWCLPAGIVAIGFTYLAFSIRDSYYNKQIDNQRLSVGDDTGQQIAEHIRKANEEFAQADEKVNMLIEQYYSLSPQEQIKFRRKHNEINWEEITGIEITVRNSRI
jgi:hypothetical protein